MGVLQAQRRDRRRVCAAEGIAPMIVAGIQHDIEWEDPPANFARLAPMIERAARDGARLVVCTEMFSTGFSMHTERIGEPADGPSAQFLVEQSRRHGVWICGSIPERGAGELPYNQLVLAAPDGRIFRYAKIHPFTYGGEHKHYESGDRFLTVDIYGVRCSFFVCYDLRFADEFWALAAGTDCYVVPANWPAARREHWMTLLRARAIENQAYVVGVNRVGTGGRIEYSGDSMIVGPFGELCAQAGAGEVVIAADVDPEHVRRVRAEYPFLPDRRS
jgi:predicted amidohydrolase